MTASIMSRATARIVSVLLMVVSPSLGLASDEKGDAAPSEAAKKENTRETPETKLLNRITVVGAPGRASGIPGSVHRISSAELAKENQAYDDIHRVMMRVPGVVITEEEGYGLRPNIGMRATGTDRSANITLMEDGVLAAPAPYAAPAAYYFPITGRMEGVEVRKGSSQIKYGPRTNGGALNLLSTSIPEQTSAKARVSAGSNDTRKLYANYGDTWKQASWLLETYQARTDGFKHLDTGGNTGFDVEDYVGKVRVASSTDAEHYQEVTLKLGYKDETSNETYLGLTDDDFERDPYRRYAASQFDKMENDHTQGLVRHFIVASDNVDVTTSLYRNDFNRNWYKLDRVDGVSLDDVLADPDAHASEYAHLTGDSASADGALAVKANNRSYYAQGVESIVGVAFGAYGTRNEMEIGARYHEDEEDRLQHTDGYRMQAGGTMVRTSEGVPGASGGGDNRVGFARAVAGFAQDEITAGDWTVVPGVRVEWIETRQDQYAAGDPERALAPIVTESSTTAVVPGIGATYRATAWLDAFAGVHKGFAPPGPGADDETLPEESVNYEAGVRSRKGGVELSVLGYFNDYENMLGKDTFSSGGSGEGDLYNAGAVRAYGLEASVNRTFDGGAFRTPLAVSYTYSRAEFLTSFQSTYEPWGTVESGDELPYLPAHVVSASIGIENERTLATLFANYTSEMRAVAGQGDIPASESTDARVVLDLTAEYGLVTHARVFASMQNLTDEAYIVSRRPSGVRPGLPRTFIAGLKFDL
ncbi:MAG: TonB-dependent receptor [Candidatus Latescibacteria bacterium]|nr:TonB-dependent receptor [Candidatus Latescibacterota bacterium]